MEKKVLLSNETLITDENFKTMMFYKKIYQYPYIVLIKLIICLFIIITSIILKIDTITKILFIYISILGIIDTFKVKEVKSSKLKSVKYDFFEDYFLVNNKEIILEVAYSDIDFIIEKEAHYFFSVLKVPMILDKNSFTIGTKEELKDILKQKTKAIFYERKE